MEPTWVGPALSMAMGRPTVLQNLYDKTQYHKIPVLVKEKSHDTKIYYLITKSYFLI